MVMDVEKKKLTWCSANWIPAFADGIGFDWYEIRSVGKWQIRD
jgi:hypothetical protein